MIKLFSMEFWIGVQFFVDLIFVVLLFGIVRQLKTNRKDNVCSRHSCDDGGILKDKSVKTAGEIMEMLEPLVHDAKIAADSFNSQINDKRNIINNLNDALDSRIISINLLLSRAESLFETQRHNFLSNGTDNVRVDGGNLFSRTDNDVFDQQKRILDLYAMGKSVQTIASELAMPEGEVDLVVSLKEKFIKMENQE